MTLLMIGAPEIIFITLIVLLLFGGKKIPELMKGLGKGMRSFKQGMNGEDEPMDYAAGESSAPQAKPTSAPEDGRVPNAAGEPSASQADGE